MTTDAWLPPDFVPPQHVPLTDGVHLRPIRASDVDIDMVAVHANQPMLWAMYGEAWGWPPTTMTREQDEEDLEHHAREMQTRETYNYAVLDTAETALLGCVYVHPVEQPGHEGDAEVTWWLVGDADPGLRRRLDAFVPEWVTTVWPFRAIAYPFNDVPPGTPGTARP